jgi:hypothetical protein
MPDLGVDERRIVERQVERRSRAAKAPRGQERLGERRVQERHVEPGDGIGVVEGVARRAGDDHLSAHYRMQLALELVDPGLAEAEAEGCAQPVIGLAVVGVGVLAGVVGRDARHRVHRVGPHPVPRHVLAEVDVDDRL